MTRNSWLRWPSREALSRDTRPRSVLGWVVRILVIAVVLWRVVREQDLGNWDVYAEAGTLIGSMIGVWLFLETTLAHRLWPSVLLLTAVVGAGGVGAQAAGFSTVGVIVWCGSILLAVERLPLAAAAPLVIVAYNAYADLADKSWTSTALTAATFCLVGYVLRLDAESRGRERRLLDQERAALAAEAESAALTERARIAREIHDVLAHSLSAQLVHLEAARLLVERDAPKEQVLERVVAARGMAREGLAETRQALSALRGDLVPVEDFLRALEGVEAEFSGTPRPLSAEASQAVRRVAQEALTNVRKHAPGASVRLRFSYEGDEALLEVRDFGGVREKGEPAAGLAAGELAAGELATSGSGYGLLGMRERAELLGGSLDAGPVDGGFVVRLRVPV